jgi:hypothetical protein
MYSTDVQPMARTKGVGNNSQLTPASKAYIVEVYIVISEIGGPEEDEADAIEILRIVVL